MFRSMFERRILTLLLGAALVVGGLSVAVHPAAGQVQATRPYTLSAGARQMLSAILRGLPPNGQRLVLNAIRTLGPQRAEAQLAQARAMPPQTLQVVGQMVVQALQGLPPQYHQAFINGLFQVSRAEEQFANQVLTQVAQTTIRINGMNADTFAQGQAAKRRTDDATIDALGPNPYPCYYAYPCY